MDDWAGRGFSGLRARRAQELMDIARIGFEALTQRARKIEVAKLPMWGAADARTALGIPRGRSAVVHFYGPDGGYLHTSVVRDGGITMMWEGARYWRAEPIPAAFDEVIQ